MGTYTALYGNLKNRNVAYCFVFGFQTSHVYVNQFLVKTFAICFKTLRELDPTSNHRWQKRGRHNLSPIRYETPKPTTLFWPEFYPEPLPSGNHLLLE